MGQGRLSSELGLSFFAVFCYCCLLDVGYLLCLHCYVRFLRGPRLGYSTNPPHIGVVDHGFMLQGSRGVGLVGSGKEEGGRGSHLDLI